MMDDTQDAADQHVVRNLVLSVCDLKQHGESPPTEKMLSSSVTLGTRLYLFGGCDTRLIYDDFHLLEIEQMKWSELPATGSKPSGRYGHSMTAYKNSVVVFGGVCGGKEDLLNNENGAASNCGGIIDSSLPQGKLDDGSVYTLDSQTLVWTKSAGSSFARHSHSASLADDMYIVFGGVGPNGEALNDIVIYELGSGIWRAISGTTGEAPTPRSGHKSIWNSKDQELLVFGGLLQDNQLYSYSPSKNAWSKVSTVGTSPVPRRYHSMDLINNRAFIFGGQTDSGITDLYILDTDEKRWKRPLYEGTVNVRGHSAAILHDKLIIYGGVRDKKDKKEEVVIEQKVSKKLFFLNVLAIKDGVGEGDFKFKLVTVGDSGVGKSCLLTRFVQDFYSDYHVSTIGVDFKTVVTMVKGKLVKLQLWDTAGQERFSVVTGNYYRNSDGFIFVYDATNRASFDHIDQWLEQVQQHHDCGPSTMKILVGNKHDLKDQIQVPESEARVKAEKLGAIFMSTSARTAANVDMAFLTAATNLVEMRKASQKTPMNGSVTGSNSIGLGGGAAPRRNTGSAGCASGSCGK